MPVNVKTNDKTTKQLTELSKTRKSNNSLNRTKQDIVAELVETAYKKECNK